MVWGWECVRTSRTQKMRVRLALLLVLLAGVSLCTASTCKAEDGPDRTLTRKAAMACAVRYIDTDHDNCISRAEATVAHKKFLTVIERAYLWVRGLPTIDKAMEDCDVNGDGKVCQSDFDASVKTCLPHCKAWKNMDHFVCQRAKDMKNKSVLLIDAVSPPITMTSK